MFLLRPFIIDCMLHNICFRAVHIPTKNNIIADSISRQQLQRFRQAAPQAQIKPVPVPNSFQQLISNMRQTDFFMLHSWKIHIEHTTLVLIHTIIFVHNMAIIVFGHHLQSLVQFVAYLSAKGLSYATVRSYLAGLSYFTKIQGFQDPTDQFLVSKLLQGLKRTNHIHDSRLPITKHLLQRIITILPSVCKENYESSLFSSAFSIAFYGLLRVSELTVTPKQNHKKTKTSSC